MVCRKGVRAGWFLDSVRILVPLNGKDYTFPCHRWLAKGEADGKTEVEIYPSEILDTRRLINYEITVVTADETFAGTKAKVFVQIYGDKGKTEVIKLESRSRNFERSSTDVFKVEAKDVGKVFKIRIGHDGSGIGSGRFLERAEVKHVTTEDKKKKKKNDEEGAEEMQEAVVTYGFPCSRWLARGEEDGELQVELLPDGAEDLHVNTYEVCVLTAGAPGAGSDADAFINIYGEYGDTGERYPGNSDNLNKLERGEEDVFIVTAVDLGPLKKLRIRHDDSPSYSSWCLDGVEIVDTKDDTTCYFPCNRWLAVDEDDGQIARELVPVDEAFVKKDEDEEGGGVTLGLEQKAMSTTYTIKLKTGEKKYAGTDANVFAILFGENDDTGKEKKTIRAQRVHLKFTSHTGIINLKACENYKNKFEQGAVNEFTVEAVDLGELEKLRIGHDNSGGSPGWFLDWAEIDAPSRGLRLRFPCGRWLDRGEDDGAIVRDLHPAELQTELYTPFAPYELKVYTGDVSGAGTDADVFVVLYGQKGICTLQKGLCVNKRERRLHFGRGAEDVFIVEMELEP
ncbi:lipoxygenase homology domain-containing protein 1-like [Syngnathoides biaculeatus]|uniref:lipoxygenase homology domain-containing protein 1-like n=1 Tax=Syngnathoides biaculeatus TaxID=300417 RepID=UPI002ADDB5E9|nr:lipoxygenase homology domain-containing protein 1-like [Syngnathoides biaculeatus]